MTDWTNHPEMQALLNQQEQQRQTLVEYLENPNLRFVAQGSMAGWMVMDRMTGRFVEGPFATQKQAEGAAYWDNND